MPVLKASYHFGCLVLEDKSDRSDRWSCQVSKDMLVYSCVTKYIWGAICLKMQILKHLLNIDDIY